MASVVHYLGVSWDILRHRMVLTYEPVSSRPVPDPLKCKHSTLCPIVCRLLAISFQSMLKNVKMSQSLPVVADAHFHNSQT